MTSTLGPEAGGNDATPREAGGVGKSMAGIMGQIRQLTGPVTEDEVRKVVELVRYSGEGDSYGVEDGVPGLDELRPVLMDLALGLGYIRNAQEPVVRGLGHYDVTKDTLARYICALAIEVGEFGNELPWKHWKTYDPNDITAMQRMKIIEEFVDVLHFIGTFMVLFDHWGITPLDVANEFRRKNEINLARHRGEVEGYGGQVQADDGEGQR